LYHVGIAAHPDRIQTDFLVIGAGVAGLRAAIELARAGRVLVAAKESLHESSSEYAQGGIAAALAEDDSIALHEQDTLFAGDGLCDRQAVHVLVSEAPRAIEELLSWGANFDREDGRLLFAREGAHSRNRVLHAYGDSTGREIARALLEHARSLPNVELRSFAEMTDLTLTAGGEVCGALFHDSRSGSDYQIAARAVLLATGGIGRVFKETTNPDIATGDGVSAAFRAGAEIEDIEFVQFHPTALHVEGAPRFLLSEALRGEGAYLRNAAGERFMERYHPLKELAPRDVVSRSIAMEIRRTGSEHVFLDLRHLDGEHLRTRFPRIYRTCLTYGVDLAKDLAPVHPAAHYAMGGIRTDLDGKTSLQRLYSAGEAACTGVHGANRLASNSLLEGIVFGARAGRAMRQHAPLDCRFGEPAAASHGERGDEETRRLIWEHCGILRTGEGLERFLAAGADRSTVGRLIALCALARRESRGAHYRLDYPEKDAAFEKHSVIDRSLEVRFVSAPAQGAK